MQEERVGFFSELIGSITGIESYWRFFRRSVGKAVLYLFLLSLIFGTLGAIRTMYDLNLGITKMINYLQFEVPDFTLENGELYVEGPMPRVVEKSENNLFMVDTTGNTDESVLEPYPDGLLLTRHEFIQKQNYSIRKQSFEMLQGIRITKADVIRFVPLLRFVNIFVVIFGFLFHFLGKLISAFWMAVAAFVISSMTRYELTFGDKFKLSIHALTVPIILKFLLKILKIRIPFFWVAYYGIAAFYLWRAINFLKENGEGEEQISDLY